MIKSIENYVVIGEDFADADDCNIPVTCLIGEVDEDIIEDYPDYKEWFQLTASNFMPGKSRVKEGVYCVIAEKREILQELVKKYVVPLYQNAIDNLNRSGENYHWNKPTKYSSS